MDMTEEDREGKECATEISLGGTPSLTTLALMATIALLLALAAATAIAALAGEDDEKQ